MAHCYVCGRWSPPDRETGYDVDGVCFVCQGIEEQTQALWTDPTPTDVPSFASNTAGDDSEEG